MKTPKTITLCANQNLPALFFSSHCSCATARHHHCYSPAPKALGKKRISWQLWTSWQKWNGDGLPVPGAPRHPYLGISCYKSHIEKGAGGLLLQSMQLHVVDTLRKVFNCTFVISRDWEFLLTFRLLSVSRKVKEEMPFLPEEWGQQQP